MDALSVGLQVGVPLALVVSLGVVRWLDGGRGRWGRRLRSRFLLGVPWGTLVVVGIVIGVYLFVQGAYWHPEDPLTIPFTSWSYFDPVGLVFAPLSHEGTAHITGNLLATVVLAPVAEFAFSHFPTDRGSSAFGSWRTNPYVRAFVAFPLGALGVGWLTSLFAWGPIIGFSGVVFAFGGFALVRFPIATVVALVGRSLVGTIYAVLRQPIVTASASPSFGPPWWAGIAIQGHLLGFLVGVLLGSLVVARRSEAERPSALRLWTGVVLATANLALWAVWWYRGDGGYVLYRGLGVGLIVVVSLLVAVTIHASDRQVFGGVTRRRLATAVLVLPLLTMGFVAVPLNATVVRDATPPGHAIHVDGYDVSYAVNVPNERVGAIDLSAFGESTRINASGVIVIDPNRTIWTEAVSAGSLEFAGQRRIRVGGLGWSKSIVAVRDGWDLVGGETVYTVGLQPAGGQLTWVYDSPARRAEPIVAGQRVAIEPHAGEFYVAVSRDNRTLGTAPLPPQNLSTTIGTVTIEHVNDTLLAVHNGTRVAVAHAEEYH